MLRSLHRAGFPAVLELAWLDHRGNTFADTVLVRSALRPGVAVRQVKEEKRQRYAELSQRFIFEPTALETSGAHGPATAAFVCDLGRRISARTDRRASGNGVAEAAVVHHHCA